MFYVLHVLSGNETRVEMLFRYLVPEELYDACFHLVRHLKKKIHGEWRDVYDRPIPGYIFLSTSDVKALYEKLREFPMFLHLLGKEDVDFPPLSKEEEIWLEKAIQKYSETKENTGNEGKVAQPYNQRLIRRDISTHYLVKSKGEVLIEPSFVKISENGEITVVFGPLLEMQDHIKKINLHKRIAEVDFMDTKTNMYLGIEIISSPVSPACGRSAAGVRSRISRKS